MVKSVQLVDVVFGQLWSLLEVHDHLLEACDCSSCLPQDINEALFLRGDVGWLG